MRSDNEVAPNRLNFALTSSAPRGVNGLRRDWLRQLQEEAGKPGLTPLLDVITRWWSTVKMIEALDSRGNSVNFALSRLYIVASLSYLLIPYDTLY